MNKIKRNILLLGLVSSFGLLGASSLPLNAEPSSSEPRFANKLPSTIDLNDSTESEIRSYYSSLDSLSASERNGTNLLKNLKPILQDFDYYSYDNVWKIYEITDRDWNLSPAISDADNGIPNTDIFRTPKRTPPLTHLSTPSTGMLMQMGQSLRKVASKNGATITRPARTENTSGANREALKPLQVRKALQAPTSTTSSQAMAE